MKKRMLSVFLALCMMLALAPAVFADETPTSMTGEAFVALASDGKITLTQDIYLTTQAEIPEDMVLTLNLNGHRITVPQTGGRSLYAICNYGDLTIMDSGENGKIISRGVENIGTMKMVSGTIESCDSNGGGAAVWNEGAFTMTGGKLAFTGEKSGNSAGAPLSNASANAVATITGGELVSPYTCLFVNSGKVTLENISLESSTSYWMTLKVLTSGSLTLRNVTVNTENGGCLENAGGTVDLYNCTFTQRPATVVPGEVHTSSTVAVSNGGTVNVHGGTYTSAGFGAYVYNSGGTIKIESGDFTASNTVLKADKSTTNADSVLNVSGGSFKAEGEGSKLTAVANEKASLTVSGGEFCEPVDEEYLSKDVKYQVSQENSTITSYHKGLSEANAAATANGGTITDLSAENPNAPAVLAVTLDADGGMVHYGIFNSERLTLNITNDGSLPQGITVDRSGYTFESWKDQHGAIRTLDETFTENTYLSAVWSGNGATKPDSLPVLPGLLDAGHTMVDTYFVDVRPMDYYFDAVNWAYEHGITGGTGKLTFSPDAPCTRAQAVTFLWRAMGSPAAKTEAKFTDVKTDAYYAAAVNWAVENGITNGTSASTFSPNATCTRAQIVTLLYRAIGVKSTSDAGFTDVPAAAYYADAVNWACANEITDGTGANKFSPDAACTRAQIVTFLYRAN